MDPAAVDVLVAVLLIAALWWLPGAVLGGALGFRGVRLLVVAPLLSVGALTVVGVWTGLVGVPWTLPVVGLVIALLAVVAVVVRKVVARRRPDSSRGGDGVPGRRDLWILGVGVALAAVVGAWTWWQSTSGLTLINQDWDIPWHANMIRLVAETDTWRTDLAGNFAYYDTVIEDAPIRNYPISFHAMTALVWPLTNLAVPEFVNAVVLVVVATQLPVSAAALTWQLSRRATASAGAALASVMLSSFPYDLLFRGPLVPLVVGLSLLGAFLATVLVTVAARRPAAYLASGVAAVGLFGAHASIAVVVAVVLCVWLLLAPGTSPRAVLARLGSLASIGAVAGVLGAPLVLDMLRESGRVSEIDWPAYQGVGQAFGEILLFSHGNSEAQWLWAAFLVVGIVAMARRERLRWYLAAYLGFVALAAMTAGSDGARITQLTAAFYNDAWRLVAAATLLSVPVVGVGIGRTAEAVLDLTRRGRGAETDRSARTTRALRAAAAVAAAAVLVPVVVSDVGRNVWSVQRQYYDGATLSRQERAVLEAVGEHVGEGEQVLNDACDGSAWMYALSDRMPMIRHFEVIPTERQLLLLQGFDEFDTNEEVRRAAAELQISWVYVAEGQVRPYLERPAGLEDLDDVAALELVESNDEARLYEVRWDRVPGGSELFARSGASTSSEVDVPGVWESPDPSPLAPQNAVCV